MIKYAFSALAVAAILSASASAVTFNDALGENFDGNPHMDIKSVSVSNTATDITFTVTLNGDIAATSWGKYNVGIDKNTATGDFSANGNGWGRALNMADGMDAWIGSWVDSGGGAQSWVFGGTWSQTNQVTPALTQFSTSYTFPLANLNLALGDTIHFDVYSTGGGGGDSANDASSNPNQTISNWPGPYTTPAGTGHVYTLVVPEPTTLGMLVGVAVLGLRRRK